MLSLDATTKSLEVKLNGAASTTELPVVATYVDLSQATFALTGSGAADSITMGGTAITAVAAPAATTTRKLNYLSIVNVDTSAAVVTVQINNSTSTRIVFKATLSLGDQLSFTDVSGWVVIDASGSRKTAVVRGMLPAGVNTGDLVRYNAATGAWETSAEPEAFRGLVLTPALASLIDAEGAVYYNSTTKHILVCTDL